MATMMLRGNRAANPIIRRWATTAAVLLLIAGCFAIAYFHATAANNNATRASIQAVRASIQATRASNTATRASIHAAKVAKCVNDALRARDKIAGEQHAADVARVAAQKYAEKIKKKGLYGVLHGPTPAAKMQAFDLYQYGEALFARSLSDYLTRSDQLRKAQLAHPLGRC